MMDRPDTLQRSQFVLYPNDTKFGAQVGLAKINKEQTQRTIKNKKQNRVRIWTLQETLGDTTK